MRPKIQAPLRINLELNPKVSARLERIQKLSASDTRTEAIRKSLAAFEKFLECEERGGQVFLRHADGTKCRLIVC